MRNCKHIIVLLVIILVIELGINQADVWRCRFDTTVSKDKRYTMEDFELINWTKAGDSVESNADPILLVHMEPQYIHNMIISITTNPIVSDISILFEDKEHKLSNISGKAKNNTTRIVIEKEVTSYIRIDPGEEQGLKLKNVSMIINPTSFHFSLSRVIGIIIIYVLGVFLIRIQKMPDYSVVLDKSTELDEGIKE